MMQAVQRKRRRRSSTLTLGNGVRLEMMLIPAGEFMIGSPDGEKLAPSDEKPQHRVRITRPFYFGKYLVTQEHWKSVMGNNPSHFTGSKNPVDSVSWEDSQKFLAKLNAKVGKQVGRFVLPTEAQWEYACRAGSSTHYFFGDDESKLDEYAWYGSNSSNTTHPVGQKKANGWGLYDMEGNVWEWCRDWYDEGYYKVSPVDDPSGPAKGKFHVQRGGSWNNGDWRCRCAIRHEIAPADSGRRFWPSRRVATHGKNKGRTKVTSTKVGDINQFR